MYNKYNNKQPNINTVQSQKYVFPDNNWYTIKKKVIKTKFKRKGGKVYKSKFSLLTGFAKELNISFENIKISLIENLDLNKLKEKKQ